MKRYVYLFLIACIVLGSIVLLFSRPLQKSQTLPKLKTVTNFSTIEFSGYTWDVFDAKSLTAPGPNYFSSSSENVWVDSSGSLHLKITRVNGKWECAEVSLPKSLGFGTYTFTTFGDIGAYDPNVSPGLFLYQTDVQEYDIEFTKRGSVEDMALQYSIQADIPQTANFFLPKKITYSTHRIVWAKDEAVFASFQGTPEDHGNNLGLWDRGVSTVNRITDGKVMLNMYVHQGLNVSLEGSKELVITKFTFVPLS